MKYKPRSRTLHPFILARMSSEAPVDANSIYPSTVDLSDQRSLFPATRALLWLDKIFLCIILVVLGLIGNMLSFIMLSRKHFKSLPASFYMKALALMDSGALIGLVGNHTMRLYSVPLNSSLYCKMVYFLIKWCAMASDWTLAILCLERSIAVGMPLKAKGFLKPRNNKIVLAVLYLCLAVYQSHVFIIYGSNDGICIVTSLNFSPRTRGIAEYASFLCTAFIIMCSNIAIIFSVLHSQKEAPNLTGNGQISTKQTLISMLIIISIVFLLLKTPYYMIKLLADKSVSTYLGYKFPDAKGAWIRFAMGIALIFAYANHAVNFYLYALSGRKYRDELKKMIVAIFLCKRPVKDGRRSETVHSTQV